MRRKRLKTVTRNGSYIEKLRALALMLAEKIDSSEEENIAPLAKQYRETINEIAELKGAGYEEDELAEILSDRKAKGKPLSIQRKKRN